MRGGSVPSPVITIDASQIREEGFSDLGELARSLPQNFSGGQNPGVTAANLGGAGIANQNITGGSGLNLRGLGPDASLTLLNGRRMAYGGFSQSVDISAIPVEAVERIEIVADGASAIYGSDAVGGVGNVVLKRDYDGVGLGARFGKATQGGLASREYTLTAGTTWRSGGLIATAKDASMDPLYSSQRWYSDQLVDPSTIYPGSDVRSGLLSAYQSVGNSVELRLDALRTERDQRHMYNWHGWHSLVTPDTTITLVSPSVEVWLANDWSIVLGGALGRDRHNQVRRDTVIATGRQEGSDVCYCNESLTWELGAEGPLLALPAGEARLAAGAGYRRNEFQHVNRVTGADITNGSESVRFGYAEVDVPLVGAGQGNAGVERLSLTAALRREDYESFGGVTTPKLGLIYAPGADFTLKGTWGRSFKAPTLFHQNYAADIWLYHPSDFGGTGYPPDATLLALWGGNPDLEPEKAKTWAVSLAWHPKAVQGLQAELTWFHVDYRNRVLQPIVNPTQALSNPIYAPFVHFSPTPEEQAAAIARARNFENMTGMPYDPEKVEVILYQQYTNVARQEIRGLDLSGSYLGELPGGTMTLRGSVSWLDSTQQTLPTQDPHDLSGTLFNPPRLSARLGGVWRRGGLSASAFGNHLGGVTNHLDGRKSASFTSLDVSLRYATADRADAWSGMEFALSVDNALDRDPPFYLVAEPLYVAPYDSTNYSPIGRFVSVSVSKRW
nr:TonB-dependent receptor [Luteimonas sp. JM171]